LLLMPFDLPLPRLIFAIIFRHSASPLPPYRHIDADTILPETPPG